MGLIPAQAQNSPDTTATIQFANGQSAVSDDFSEPVAVQPGEVVTVTIQFGSNHAGEPIDLGPLDGGRIGNASTAVSEGGQASFSFQSATSSGNQRVVVRYGLRTLLIQFWVLSSNPQKQPAGDHTGQSIRRSLSQL